MAHEILVDLFKNRPSLAAEILVEVLGLSLSAYTEARLASADLTEIQPADYRAGVVVLLGRDRSAFRVCARRMRRLAATAVPASVAAVFDEPN
jgi:hypothetical protein